MKSRPRILFLSHSASRNGASILLLNFLRWVKETASWEVEVLIHGRGPLVPEFRAVARTRVLRNFGRLLGVLPRRWSDALKPVVDRWCVKALLAGRRFDLIYANTAAVWPYVEALRSKRRPVLWHIHELPYALRLEIPEAKARELFPTAAAFIAVSKPVGTTLAHEYGVPPTSIELIPGFVPLPAVDREGRTLRRGRVRERLGWSADEFVVGGCGAVGWRKGTDLFLQAARNITADREYDGLRFLWVGGGLEEKDELEFEYDVRALGLERTCKRVRADGDVSDYYCAMDVFALTSREDPFPLVMLEAAAHGLPIVCFAKSGGGPSFVESDAGLIARCQDVNAFADHILTLYHDASLRHRLGTGAAGKVRERYTAASQAARLSSLIARHGGIEQ